MTISKEQLAAAVAEIRAGIGGIQSAVDTLQSYVDSWDPPEPPVRRIRYAQHKYDNASPTDLNLFDVYDLQRGWRTLAPMLDPAKELYIFTAFVKRPADSEGLTQFLPPAQVPTSWLARTTAGALIHRDINSGDYLIDITNPLWLAQAIPNVVQLAKINGAHGVYLDEVDWVPFYAWPQLKTATAAKFPTEAAWRAALSGIIDKLASALHAEDLRLWINLGANYDVNDPWQGELLRRVDGVNIEFFVGREGVGQQPATGTAWKYGVNFIKNAERMFGVPVHAHCSSMNQDVIDYAFMSWLLGTELLGSFSANVKYDATVGLPRAVFRDGAELLGDPTGVYTTNSFGIDTRQFENGNVQVNSTTSTKGSLPPMSGRITVNP